MKRSSGHLLRFIDLGLLLLLAFLSVAELNPTLQVALPSKSDASEKVIVARVSFNQNWDATVKRLANSELLCQTTTVEELAACMENQKSIRFLLAPKENSTVQQIVTLLDICSALSLRCAIEPIQT
ncbi:MAG: hypothetical protein OXE92_05320 [Bacteroidetes bacterium]|nr:hypothetical protein [Bacteroidota bacterium]MCY4205129.1 hypothetical protein [Bacteroidota bacterium]